SSRPRRSEPRFQWLPIRRLRWRSARAASCAWRLGRAHNAEAGAAARTPRCGLARGIGGPLFVAEEEANESVTPKATRTTGADRPTLLGQTSRPVSRRRLSVHCGWSPKALY